MLLLGATIPPQAYGGRTFIAVLAGLDTAALNQQLSLEKEDTQTYSSIVAPDGNYIINNSRYSPAVPKGANIFSALEQYAVFDRGYSLEQLQTDLRSGGTGISALSPDGGDWYLHYAPIPGTDWDMLTTAPYEVVDAKVADCLKKVTLSSNHPLALINDVLDMSKIESGKVELRRARLDFRSFLESLGNLYYAQARGRGIHCETTLLGDVDEALVGNSLRLNQILANPLSNALKFTPPGGTVVACIREEETTQHGASYSVRVSDSGVELMGGELKLRSKPGKGSEFYFTVILPKGSLPEAPAPQQGAIGRLRGAHILVAEDNDLNAEIVTELLALQGLDATRAENGRAAVALFQDSVPGYYQLILMDIMMPEINGLDAVQAIRALPIVAMTANAFQEDVDGAMAAGMTVFLSKPVDEARLYAELAQALGGQ